MRQILCFLIVTVCSCSYATTSYINLSNTKVRKQQLETLSDNASNAVSIGFQQEYNLSGAYNHKEKKKKATSYVMYTGSYINTQDAPIKYTGRNFDFATKTGYFKVITPLGIRYTTDGSSNLNIDRELVNANGYRYLSANGDVITIPRGISDIYISHEGFIYAGDVEVDRIGVFDIPRSSILKEKHGLYKSDAQDVLLEDVEVLYRHLRESNVNIADVSAKMSNISNSAQISSQVLKDCSTLELNVINKVMK